MCFFQLKWYFNRSFKTQDRELRMQARAIQGLGRGGGGVGPPGCWLMGQPKILIGE